jgi:hypothetical protein
VETYDGFEAVKILLSQRDVLEEWELHAVLDKEVGRNSRYLKPLWFVRALYLKPYLLSVAV